MIWFTADTHFGHENILRLAGRPWDEVAAMNRDLVAGINSCVKPSDELYVMGDFSFRISKEEAAELRGQILCKHVHLVPGNHDRDWTKPDFPDTFLVEPPLCQVRYAKRRFILCHYPLCEWNGMGQGAIHVHGHIHTQGDAYNRWNRDLGFYRYDVGCDANRYRPVSADELIGWFQGVDYRPYVDWGAWEQAMRAAQGE